MDQGPNDLPFGRPIHQTILHSQDTRAVGVGPLARKKQSAGCGAEPRENLRLGFSFDPLLVFSERPMAGPFGPAMGV